MIIGFSGKAHSGKDTAAAFMQQFGFEQLAFARRLKESAKIVYGLTDEQVYGEAKEIIDIRWGRTPRRILQVFGADLRRGNPDVWVESLFNLDVAPVKDYAISDLRFFNEAERICDQKDGFCVRIERPGAGLKGSEANDISEKDLDLYSFDATIINDGTVDNFYDKLTMCYLHLLDRGASNENQKHILF